MTQSLPPKFTDTPLAAAFGCAVEKHTFIFLSSTFICYPTLGIACLFFAVRAFGFDENRSANGFAALAVSFTATTAIVALAARVCARKMSYFHALAEDRYKLKPLRMLWLLGAAILLAWSSFLLLTEGLIPNLGAIRFLPVIIGELLIAFGVLGFL